MTVTIAETRNVVTVAPVTNAVTVAQVNNTVEIAGPAAGGGGVSAHSALTGLLSDDHTQYPLSVGRSGGQSVIGGTGPAENLLFQSTSHPARGDVLVNDRLHVVNTGVYHESLHTTLTHTGSGASIIGYTMDVINQASGAGDSTTTGYEVNITHGRTSGTSEMFGQVFIIQSSVGSTNLTRATAVRVEANWAGGFPNAIRGVQVDDLNQDGSAMAQHWGLVINEQTAGATDLRNIYQVGTTGVNTLAAATLIGADASPAAGVALELRGGALRLAATPNNIIQNSAGTTAITLSTSAPIISLTGATVRFATSNASLQNSAGTRLIQMRAAGVRLDPAIAINADPATGIRFLMTEDAAFGAGQSAIMGLLIASYQSDNKPDTGAPGEAAYKGFSLEGAHDITGFNLGTIAGIHFGYGILDSIGGGVVDENAPLLWDKAFADTATVTESWAADIRNWPGGIRQRQTTITNRLAGNTMIGADSNSSHPLTVTGKAYITTEIEIDGDLNHDGANVGFYGVAPVARPSAYTQAYATANKTHADFTSADIAAFTGGVVGFLDTAERNNIRTQFNALRADVADVKQLANSIIDDLQAEGLLQ